MTETYLTIDDNESMGLNNTICTEKDYFCKSHRVFLSENDVSNKGCLCKLTFDMISTKRCAWLVKL